MKMVCEDGNFEVDIDLRNQLLAEIDLRNQFPVDEERKD